MTSWFQPRLDGDAPLYSEVTFADDMCNLCDSLEKVDVTHLPGRDTKRALKRMMKERTSVHALCNSASLDNIRQVSKMQFTLCCVGAIQDGDFERFMKTFDNQVVCTRLEPNADGRTLSVHLLATHYMGRKRLAEYARATYDRDTFFFVQLNDGDFLKHILSSPVILNPSTFIPFYFDKNMKICECCHRPAENRCPCNDVWYCSIACQQKDWRLHKKTCFSKKKRS